MVNTSEAPAAAERQIEYLTPPTKVSMTDGYFELASLGHFWVRRRFEVFQKLAGELVSSAREMAEIGWRAGAAAEADPVGLRSRGVLGFDLN